MQLHRKIRAETELGVWDSVWRRVRDRVNMKDFHALFPDFAP
jgi:hypothetical protein